MGAKQLIILLITSLLATACAREAISPTDKTEGKVPVSLRLLFDNNTRTRTSWEYDRYFPDIRDEEKRISNVMIIVFKNVVLEEYNYFDGEDFTQDPDDFSIFLEDEEGKDVLELEPGPHYFYAIANIPADMRAILEAALFEQEGKMTKDNFERIIVEISLDYLTNDDHFIMTNNTPPTLRGIYSKEQIENNTELNNEVQLTVGRTVGKVSFAYVASEVQTGELHGSLSNIRYKLLNNPAKMYVMPVIENDILLTPHYNGSYPAGYFTPSAKDANIMENTTSSPWLQATTAQTLTTTEELAYTYCIENNNKSSIKSNSTMLLIEAVFTPDVWLNSNGTKGTPSSDGTFYRVGCFNTQGVLYAYEPGYYKEEPSAEIMNEYQKKLDQTRDKVSVYKIVKYSGGITYYGFWLKHTDQYMVKRNSYYKVAITHIHGAGVPEPGDVVDPDVDPEDPATYGRLAVYAVTWIDENIEISIGEEPGNEDIAQGDGTLNPKEWEDEQQDEDLKKEDENKFN